MRDILTEQDPQIIAIQSVLNDVDADILLLTDIDFDLGLVALQTFNGQLTNPFPHLFARQPNSGVFSGVDWDEDGRSGEPEDAQGYGRFTGDGGLAVLSRFPFGDGVQEFTELIWADTPGANLPDVSAPEIWRVQRMSSRAHWSIPVEGPTGDLTLLAFYATPPVFDGEEDRNGYRNRDEILFWVRHLDGLIGTPPSEPFIVIGNANLDPGKGEGQRDAIISLLHDPRIQDPKPMREMLGISDDERMNTVDWPEPVPGDLRVSYILPSADVSVVGSGVVWPYESPDPAGAHKLVWMDVILP